MRVIYYMVNVLQSRSLKNGDDPSQVEPSRKLIKQIALESPAFRMDMRRYRHSPPEDDDIMNKILTREFITPLQHKHSIYTSDLQGIGYELMLKYFEKNFSIFSENL